MNRRLVKIISPGLAIALRPVNFFRDLRLRSAYGALADLAHQFSAGMPIAKRLLIDGHFLNPGYFYRLQLFRAAVSSVGGDELGLVWRYKTSECRRILSAIGVGKTQFFLSAPDPRLRGDARRLFQAARTSQDLLNLKFPFGVPASFLYDDILKRQRSATVDITDPLVERQIWEFISSIRAAEEILEKHDPDYVAMSHAITLQCTPIAWLAAKQDIPVVTLFGNYGLPRFWRMNEPEDIYYGMDRPERKDLDSLDPVKSQALRDIGRNYLIKRFSGKTNDLGGQMAFAGTNKLACGQESMGGKPVVAVYASNWFDFPHALGMTYFDDFLDWMRVTLQSAIANTSVHWLFRAHPCDKWYGGVTLRDLIPKNLPDHITFLSDDYSGQEVMSKADALVTFHGTAGIEFASQGKPVLVSDRGWYHDCGFTVFPESREHYLHLLSQDWFSLVDTKSIQQRAEIFAGWYFCCPRWQEGAIMPDDSDKTTQIKIFRNGFLDLNKESIGREINTIRKWLASGTSGYHTFKMASDNSYAMSNVI